MAGVCVCECVCVGGRACVSVCVRESVCVHPCESVCVCEWYGSLKHMTTYRAEFSPYDLVHIICGSHLFPTYGALPYSMIGNK